MNEYDGICWMGWIIIFAYFIGAALIWMLLFGYGAILWYIACIIAVMCFAAAKSKTKTKQVIEEDVPYFTDEDFMHCKIGEWVSRK